MKTTWMKILHSNYNYESPSKSYHTCDKVYEYTMQKLCLLGIKECTKCKFFLLSVQWHDKHL